MQESERPWTIFLDRDGVINKRLIGDYVKSWEEFEFLPGVLEALKRMDEYFGRVIIITNQQGVGKGLMTEKDLEAIHSKMLAAIEDAGGRIDEVIYCPDLASKQPNCRKPNPTMAHIAKNLHPEVDFKKSIMVGDTEADIDFGKSVGMKTIFVGNTNRYKKLSSRPNIWYTDLLAFSSDVENLIF